MLRLGSVILSLWCVLNIVPAAFILATTLCGVNHPLLGVKLKEEEIATLSSDALAFINSVGLYANGTVIALSLLALIAIWAGLFRRIKWVFWSLLIAMVFYVIAGFAADFISQSNYYVTSIISASILALGFGLVARDLLQSK